MVTEHYIFLRFPSSKVQYEQLTETKGLKQGRNYVQATCTEIKVMYDSFNHFLRLSKTSNIL